MEFRSTYGKFPCPVCGNTVEEYEICEICHWENTGPENIPGGPNHELTLEEAQRIWKETGKPVKNIKWD